MSLYFRAAVVSSVLAVLTAAAVLLAPRPEDVRVVDHAPKGNGVPHDAIISITFSRPVDRRSVVASFVLYPPVRGRINWVDDTTMLFVPAEPLAPATEYRVTLQNGLRDARGRANVGESSWPFFTAPE